MRPPKCLQSASPQLFSAFFASSSFDIHQEDDSDQLLQDVVPVDPGTLPEEVLLRRQVVREGERGQHDLETGLLSLPRPLFRGPRLQGSSLRSGHRQRRG